MTRWANEHRYDAAVHAAHDVYKVPIPTIKAVIAQESGFVERARRGEAHIEDASIGLMQLLMRTARSLGYMGVEENLYTPSINIHYGTKLLSQLHAQTDYWPDAISAYNGGMRPRLGFGAVATYPLPRICLEWEMVGGTKRCKRWHNTPTGEYANQAYVDSVLDYNSYFGFDEATGSPPTQRGERWKKSKGQTSVVVTGGIGVAMLAAGLGLAWMISR